jgi:hypothetical protein
MSSEHHMAKGTNNNNKFTFQLLRKVCKKRRNLQPWNVGEKHSNTKSDDGCKKDIDILRWRVLERAQSAASSCEQVTNGDVMKKRWIYCMYSWGKGTNPHCMRTKVKKYTLCASWRRSFVKRGQLPYLRTRDEKGTPFDCRYQKELFYNV